MIGGGGNNLPFMLQSPYLPLRNFTVCMRGISKGGRLVQVTFVLNKGAFRLPIKSTGTEKFPL